MQRDFPVTTILDELQRDNLLPGILFRTSRKQCDDDVTRLSKAKIGTISDHEQQELRERIDEILIKYSIEREVITEHAHFAALIRTAAGAHHAGQLLQWRLVLEELMSAGKLRLMIATGTVAAGVDFPARSVIITAHSKRGAEGFNNLTPSEFQQMSGRAGRRGKDAVGICLIAPGHFSDARVIHEVANRPPEPLRSAYFAAPSSVLNLLKYRTVDDLKYMISNSLASFVDRKSASGIRLEADELEAKLNEDSDLTPDQKKKIVKRARRRRREAEELEQRQLTQLDLSLSGLEALGYLDSKGLTEKGMWAAELCTSLVLQLADAIEEGLFYDIPAIELAALVGSIAGDAHRVYFSLAKNVLERERYDALAAVVDRVKKTYQGPTTTSETKVIPHGGLTVTTWMCSDNWSNFASLLKLAGVAEGDAARLVTQTADHLSQICRLYETHPELARTASEARDALLRPPLSDSLLIK
ncbi:MAG: hypothetical protein KDD55_03670 [Bdellovibrionales bacterium]|nr:hypothetical protein [Bdellovibrionales bacterium]